MWAPLKAGARLDDTPGLHENGLMTAPAADFYYDFLDPLSYLVGQELAGLDPAETVAVRWLGAELRPPPTPLTSLDDPELTLAARSRESRAILQIDAS